MQSLFKRDDFARTLEADLLDRMRPIGAFAVDDLIGGVLCSTIHDFRFSGRYDFPASRKGNRRRGVMGLHFNVILTTCQVRSSDGGIVVNEDAPGILRF